MARSTRPCYWSGCTVTVQASMLMCRKHWFSLPKALRDRVWAAYEPGQEETLNLSEEYVAVLDDVKRFIRDSQKTPA